MQIPIAVAHSTCFKNLTTFVNALVFCFDAVHLISGDFICHAIWPRGYATLSMLNSTEHEICPANKSQITNKCKLFSAKHS